MNNIGNEFEDENCIINKAGQYEENDVYIYEYYKNINYNNTDISILRECFSSKKSHFCTYFNNLTLNSCKIKQKKRKKKKKKLFILYVCYKKSVKEFKRIKKPYL